MLSAGAMNGVVLAAGLAKGGVTGGRANLEAFWRAVSDAADAPFGKSGLWTDMLSPAWLRATPGWQMAQNWAQTLSPYELNPLNFNPLRGALDGVKNRGRKCHGCRAAYDLWIQKSGARSRNHKIVRIQIPLRGGLGGLASADHQQRDAVGGKGLGCAPGG